MGPGRDLYLDIEVADTPLYRVLDKIYLICAYAGMQSSARAQGADTDGSVPEVRRDRGRAAAAPRDAA